MKEEARHSQDRPAAFRAKPRALVPAWLLLLLVLLLLPTVPALGASLPTYQATFSAAFVTGDNALAVAYRQPLGKYEHGHGYFSQGRFTDFFRYELWPLSEWPHASSRSSTRCRRASGATRATTTWCRNETRSHAAGY